MSLKVFIGSSTEAQSKMQEIAAWIEDAKHEPQPWTDAKLFPVGSTTIESLHTVAEEVVDAAVFVFSEDDKTWYRGKEYGAPRDNVLFEYGLFSGVLGRTSVAIAVVGQPKRPYDLLGITDLSLNKPANARLKLVDWLSRIKPRVREERCGKEAVTDNTDQRTNAAEANVRAQLLRAVNKQYDVAPTYLDFGRTSYVYRAEDPALKRSVAIKVFNPYANIQGSDGAIFTEQQLRERFAREMEEVADLKHRNVMGVYAGRQDGELPFVVLEFVNGIRLDAVIRKTGVQPLRKVCKFVSEIAHALSYAHQKGYIRHKLCPSNILIDKEGHPVISPFRITRESSGLVGTADISVETLKYSSPEEFNGLSGEINEAADQYSLGLIAHEMLSGRETFPYSSWGQIKQAKETFINSTIDIKAIRPNCPDELRDVVSRMLSVKATDRFPHLEDISRILSSVDLDGPLEKDSDQCKMMHIAMQSFARCRESTEFFQDFYQELFTKCEPIRKLFSKVDLQTQYYLLREALDLILQFPTEVGLAPRYLSLFKVAESHNNLNIDPALYDAFSEHLLEMVQRHDPKCTRPDGQCDTDIIKAWKVTIQPAIEYMKPARRGKASSGTAES